MINTIRLKTFNYQGIDGELNTIKPIIKENIMKSDYSFFTLSDLFSLYKNNSKIAVSQGVFTNPSPKGEFIGNIDLSRDYSNIELFTNLFILDFDIFLYKSLTEKQLQKYQSIIYEQFRKYSSFILPNQNNFIINQDSSQLSYRLFILCNKPINIDNTNLNTYYNYYIKLCYFISKHIDLTKSNLNNINIVIKPILKNGRIDKTFLGYNQDQLELVKLGDSIASNVDLINNYYYQTQSVFNQWEYSIKELVYKSVKF